MQIAIDGPAASGKSTVAKILASKLKATYIDTGAMFRAVTLYLLKQEGLITRVELWDQNLADIEIQLEMTESGQKVFLNQEDVTEAIRSQEVSRQVSKVAANLKVREYLLKEQRRLAKDQDVVMDGRDIGTTVLPQANYKFFMIASSRVRAQRRFDELSKNGHSPISIEQIEKDIQARDEYDRNRKYAPLKKAEDAIEIDTSNMTIDEVVEKMLTFISRNA
ncbi:(d)CMP kinase [Facklamia hominis]|uniref:Cytidylate kinase n=2 Tax=Facklamia hominis TaxID=178214 RepID=K1LVR2_9LACT|nr:(d)CMP kinase [Facklamia hominis]EKB56227.1 cytidylate kinase [Facklamia hominis CCUG 36813]MDK7186471.1 (d)CMP kinase [Facklamia hominis]